MLTAVSRNCPRSQGVVGNSVWLLSLFCGIWNDRTSLLFSKESGSPSAREIGRLNFPEQLMLMVMLPSFARVKRIVSGIVMLMHRMDLAPSAASSRAIPASTAAARNSITEPISGITPEIKPMGTGSAAHIRSLLLGNITIQINVEQ